MGCCAPNAVGPGPASADPCKRVNYTLGMLLGVDDFVQESAYHIARREELGREMLGYGTVHGLQVVVEADGDRGPRVRVTPGMAWLPSGTPVCVGSAQCAGLNDWLQAHAAELPVVSPMVGWLPLFVVLSHAQCLTDNVPIPGEPCRSDDDLMQPSRVADGFRLELRLAPPPQREEDAIRDFVAWLLTLPMAPSSPPLTEADFVQQLREAARAWLAPSSPPVSPPDFMLGAAPAGTSEALFATALRLWTTELRPLWMARADCGCDAPPIGPKDDAVLLAELQLALVATADGWRVSDVPDVHDAVTQDESRRPYVLSLRMVQELVTRHPVPDPGNSVVSETAFGQAADAGASLQFSRADHTHGSPSLPDLGGDLSGPVEAAFIESLQGVPLASASPLAEGDVLTLVDGQWTPRAPVTPPLPDLGGDLSGPVEAAFIESLQGVPLSSASPVAEGDVLTLVGGQWAPRAPVTPPAPPPPNLVGDVIGAPGGNQIAALQGRTLNAPNPAANQVLTFIGGQWQAADLPAQGPAPTPGPAPEAPTQGDFVDRGDPGRRFQIVAAAEFDLLLRAGGRRLPTLRHRYGQIEGVSAIVDPQQPRRTVIRLRVKVPDAQKFQGHIVKLTAVWTEGTPFGFQLYLLDQVVAEGEAALELRVLLLAEKALSKDQEQPFRFQLELSRFEEAA